MEEPWKGADCGLVPTAQSQPLLSSGPSLSHCLHPLLKCPYQDVVAVGPYGWLLRLEEDP